MTFLLLTSEGLPEKQSAVVLLMRKVIVEKGSLGVTNVEVSTRQGYVSLTK